VCLSGTIDLVDGDGIRTVEFGPRDVTVYRRDEPLPYRPDC
jgi:hypothetical protein